MTDDDLVKAREAERVMREYAAHPSSSTVPDSEQARSVADTIAALLDEVERLNSPVVLSEWQKLVTERDALIAEVRDREDVLERAGFRRCDISACNCGSWHQVGGFKARFDEIKEAIAEHVDLNGKTLLTAVQEALAERNALAREVDACAAALPGPYYMDPPDGGDVPISEQVKRMARDAARIQWLDEHALSMDAVADPDGFVWVWHGTDPARKIRGKTLREAIDRAMKGASDE